VWVFLGFLAACATAVLVVLIASFEGDRWQVAGRVLDLVQTLAVTAAVVVALVEIRSGRRARSEERFARLVDDASEIYYAQVLRALNELRQSCWPLVVLKAVRADAELSALPDDSEMRKYLQARWEEIRSDHLEAAAQVDQSVSALKVALQRIGRPDVMNVWRLCMIASMSALVHPPVDVLEAARYISDDEIARLDDDDAWRARITRSTNAMEWLMERAAP
jgi:hypothetical protein